MTVSDNLTAGLNKIFNKAGQIVTVHYFNTTVGSVWDDEEVLTLSGTVSTTGLILPLSTKYGSRDAVLVEQGMISPEDKKLYVAGSLNLMGDLTGVTGSMLNIRIALGAAGTDSYSLVYGGVPYSVSETDIYKQAYIRKLPTGSLYGES
jgi:hypothetical protein